MRTLILGIALGCTFGTAAGAVAATPVLAAAPLAMASASVSGPAGIAPRAPRTKATKGKKTAEKAPRATPTAPVAAAPKAAAPAAPSKSGIVNVGNNTWEVPESIIDRYVSDPGALSGQAGASQVDDGWKLTSVKSGSRVSQMGLQSGDVITSVNGYGLGSLTATWWASTHLKNEDLYRVSIERGGSPQTLKYRVID